MPRKKTDDQEDTGSTAYMPNVQALAAQGMTFKNSFVNFSLCSPSRSSFFTGQAEIDNKVKDLRYASDAAVGDAARPPRQAQILRG